VAAASDGIGVRSNGVAVSARNASFFESSHSVGNGGCAEDCRHVSRLPAAARERQLCESWPRSRVEVADQLALRTASMIATIRFCSAGGSFRT
jgi:hypothetical protein